MSHGFRRRLSWLAATAAVASPSRWRSAATFVVAALAELRGQVDDGERGGEPRLRRCCSTARSQDRARSGQRGAAADGRRRTSPSAQSAARGASAARRPVQLIVEPAATHPPPGQPPLPGHARSGGGRRHARRVPRRRERRRGPHACIDDRAVATARRCRSEAAHRGGRRAQRAALVLLAGDHRRRRCCSAGSGVVVSRTALAPVRRLTDAAERGHATARPGPSHRGRRGDDELGRLAAILQHDARARWSGRARPAAAGRRRLARAAHAAHQPAHQRRGARARERPAAGRARASGAGSSASSTSSRRWSATWSSWRAAASADEPIRMRLDELAARRRRARAPARARGATSTPTLEPLVVRGARARLDRAVDNLLDNAVKWSPRGRPDRGAWWRDGELTVRDHGPGSPRRTCRTCSTASTAPRARGAARLRLGLAIVRQVAEAHGGSVAAEPASGPGERACALTLPLSHHLP